MVKSHFNRETGNKTSKNIIKSIVAIAIMLGIGLLMIYNAFIKKNEEGNYVLSEERVAKLEKELDELENVEQYVLLASQDGYYPCFSCVEKNAIFLKRGQIWKYGVTRKGEKIRFRNFLADNSLSYIREFIGPLQECLRLEKIKIYNYALLPENLAREVPLIRPPGNKQDN